MKIINRFDLLAVTANQVSIRVAASSDNPHP
jgi:hypothetical protein